MRPAPLGARKSFSDRALRSRLLRRAAAKRLPRQATLREATVMDDIVRISSAAPWEPIFGYSRAVRAGEWVAVSGSTGLDEHGQLVGRGQIYVQTRQAIANI